jgi:four helix bundle protein
VVDPRDLVERTQRFAVDAIRFVRGLTPSRTLEPVVRQLVRSSSSVGANYRAARRSRSYREFAARLAIAVEEADETVYWLEVLSESSEQSLEGIERLLAEGRALRAILGRAWSTASARVRAARAGKT